MGMLMHSCPLQSFLHLSKQLLDETALCHDLVWHLLSVSGPVSACPFSLARVIVWTPPAAKPFPQHNMLCLHSPSRCHTKAVNCEPSHLSIGAVGSLRQEEGNKSLRAHELFTAVLSKQATIIYLFSPVFPSPLLPGCTLQTQRSRSLPVVLGTTRLLFLPFRAGDGPCGTQQQGSSIGHVGCSKLEATYRHCMEVSVGASLAWQHLPGPFLYRWRCQT